MKKTQTNCKRSACLEAEEYEDGYIQIKFTLANK